MKRGGESEEIPGPHEKAKSICQQVTVPRTGTGALAEKAKALGVKPG